MRAPRRWPSSPSRCVEPAGSSLVRCAVCVIHASANTCGTSSDIRTPPRSLDRGPLLRSGRAGGDWSQPGSVCRQRVRKRTSSRSTNLARCRRRPTLRTRPAGSPLYPGGLVLHTALNLQAALAIRAAIGAAGAATVALDDIIEAQVLHDVMKAHLLRWRPDGHPSTEPRVATTWLHHILILAEGLLRRFPARALLAIASVHADPSVDPRKVAGFLHAAALVAGLDPGSTQLLRAIG